MAKIIKNFFNFLVKKKKLIFIQKKTILTIFLIVFVFESFIFLKVFQIIPYEGFLANIMPGFLIDLTNQERSSMELNRLKINPLLERAASLKAQDMAQKGYFSHYSPEGITPWHWFKEAGYQFSYAGENLAVNFIDSAILHQAWLDSEKHRENILNKNFTEIGVGTAEGIYKGRNAIFVVQLFGRPKITSLAVISEPIEKPTEPIEEIPEVDLPEEPEEPAIERPVLVLGDDSLDNLEVIEERDSFIAVKSLEEEIVEEVIPLEEIEVRYSTLMARTLSSPKKSINFLLVFLSSFLVISSIFAFFKKPKMSTGSLVTNGMIILFIIGGSVYINHWIFSLFGSVL